MSVIKILYLILATGVFAYSIFAMSSHAFNQNMLIPHAILAGFGLLSAAVILIRE